MKWKGWLKDKKGVSPVIGVILMVAITVILAAVIAGFVFGMGSKVKSAPQVQFLAEYTNGNVVITCLGGETVNPNDIVIQIVDNNGNVHVLTYNNGQWSDGTYTAAFNDNDNNNVISAGDTITINNVDLPIELRIIYKPLGTVLYDTKLA